MSKDDLMSVPLGIGRKILMAGSVVACPVLGTDKFVDYCCKRNVRVDRERLVCLERLGLFRPIFRVVSSDDCNVVFNIPIQCGNDWFMKGWAIDTASPSAEYVVPAFDNYEQEAYYSIFQIDELYILLSMFTCESHMDLYIDGGFDAEQWLASLVELLDHARFLAKSFVKNSHRFGISILCQFISNRYFPHTQGDMRRIRAGGRSYGDKWIAVNESHWDWKREIRLWNPEPVAELFALTPQKLRHAFEDLAIHQDNCDPLSNWYKLIQFIPVEKRDILKGDALFAETMRGGAHMLRLLYKDLYGDSLPHPNEVTRAVHVHMPELSIREDTLRYMEFVVNQFNLNPRPRLCLIVEGQSEEAFLNYLFRNYYGAHCGKFGIEIVVMHGVDNATGSKEDRYRAILRLVDYLHSHHVFTFIILDRENNADKLKREARNQKSLYRPMRSITRYEYVKLWKQSFEFDNFSCTELAFALTSLTGGRVVFNVKDVAECKANANPGKELSNIYRDRSGCGLNKIDLSIKLCKMMLDRSSRRKVENRLIVQVVDRVVRLANRNTFPGMLRTWEKNQQSRFFGKKI